MSKTIIVSRGHFDHALSPEFLRIAQVIQGALTGGPLVFASVVLLVNGMPSAHAPTTAAADMVTVMSVVHLVMAFAVLFLGSFLAGKIFSPGAIAVGERDTVESLAIRYVILQRTAILIRMALLEGAAFFGLVTLLIASRNGLLQEYPLLWVNFFSTAALLVTSALTFPTRERLTGWFEARMTNVPLA